MRAIQTLFASLEQAPAVQSLRQRVEKGGVLFWRTVNVGAQPFLAALLRHLFRSRPLVIVTPGAKTQESVQQDVETWLQVAGCIGVRSADNNSHPVCKALYYPAWETLPQEARL